MHNYLSEMEELTNRHRNEKKNLQAQTQGIKNSAPKIDKQKRAECFKRIKTLEIKLSEKHAKEMIDLSSSLNSCELASASNEISGKSHLTKPIEIGYKELKQSRAARRRQKAADLQKSLDIAVQNDALAYNSSSRGLEFSKFDEILFKKNLKLHKVISDGDCLYASVAHQLKQKKNIDKFLIACKQFDIADIGSTPTVYLEDAKLFNLHLRKLASAFIMKNSEEFLPFLVTEDGTEKSYEHLLRDYCLQLETPGTWGGNLELRAISSALCIPIEVLQYNCSPIIIGNEFKTEPIVLTFHRHAYSLGEHYNSCKSIDNE